MLTIEQCRAARGLLDWTQQNLADASGLSKTAINNFEKGHSDIKSESLKAIQMAFESADIEFTSQSGVRRKVDQIQTLKGSESFSHLLNDIYETLRGASNAEILINNIDEHLTTQITAQKLKEYIEHCDAENISTRALCTENEANPLTPVKNCRWHPKTHKAVHMPTIIYGSKVAFELWEQSMIIIVDSPEASNAERKRFETLWIHAKAPASAENNKAAAHNTARSS